MKKERGGSLYYLDAMLLFILGMAILKWVVLWIT